MPSAGGAPGEGEVGDQGNRKQIRAFALGLKEQSVHWTKNKEQRKALTGKKNISCNCAGSRVGIRTQYVLNG